MRLLIACVVVAWVWGSGCAKPDLGESPFYCNNGYPVCPEGYVCDQPGVVGGRCVKSGSTLPPPPDAAVPDRPAPDQPRPTVDLPPVKPDTRRADGPSVKWDKGPVDMPPLKPDGIPPHLGCQSNSECSDPSSPCCCPLPLLPQIWDCLPLCFNPFCI